MKKMDKFSEIYYNLNAMKCSDCNSNAKTATMYFLGNFNPQSLVFSVYREELANGQKICCDKFAVELEKECKTIMSYIN